MKRYGFISLYVNEWKLWKASRPTWHESKSGASLRYRPKIKKTVIFHF